MQDYFFRVRRVLLWILVLNWAVALAKFAYGLMSHCVSMTADGLHSFSDGATNVIGLIGIWVAAKPVDKNHPYGHKKYETFTSLAVAFLLFLLVLVIIHEAMSRMAKGTAPVVNLSSFAVMLATMCVNFFVMAYERKKGVQLGSDLLVADALHTRSDILVSSGVIAALVGAKLGYPVIDVVAAFVISGFIAKMGFDIMRCSSSVLCDSAVVAVEEIKRIVLGIDGVKECHDIRTRGRSDDVHVDLHLLVDESMSVGRAHEISNMVENKIKNTVKGVTDVVVHIEPAPEKRNP